MQQISNTSQLLSHPTRISNNGLYGNSSNQGEEGSAMWRFFLRRGMVAQGNPAMKPKYDNFFCRRSLLKIFTDYHMQNSSGTDSHFCFLWPQAKRLLVQENKILSISGWQNCNTELGRERTVGQYCGPENYIDKSKSHTTTQSGKLRRWVPKDMQSNQFFSRLGLERRQQILFRFKLTEFSVCPRWNLFWADLHINFCYRLIR